MAAMSSVQRMGWPVSASTLAAASKALRRLFSAAAGSAASVFVALEALAVSFAAGVLAGFFFLLAMMLLLENAGYPTQAPRPSRCGNAEQSYLTRRAAIKAILRGILDF